MDIDLVFNTGNQEAAAKWLEFWHTAKYQGQVINQSGFVPNQQSYFKEIPEFTDPANVMVAQDVYKRQIIHHRKQAPRPQY